MRVSPPLLFLFFVGACAEPADGAPPTTGAPADAKPKAAEAPAACAADGLPQRGLKLGKVVIEAEPKPIELKVELCLNNQERQTGMMCRTEIGPDEGMLFVFPQMRPRSFWMKNTLIPLDMVFLDDEGRIVGIVERAEPLTLSSRKVDHPSQFVLEIGGGRAKALGLREGMWAKFGGIPSGMARPAVRLEDGVRDLGGPEGAGKAP